jgi:hypothetical protein
MYTKVNLNKPTGIAPGSAAQKNEIVLVEAQDLNFPDSDEKGVKLVGVPTLKEGGKFITLYSTKSKTDAPFESDGDEDMMNITQKFVAVVPGNGLELKEFVQNWIGKDVVIFHKSCKEAFYEVMGSPCAPLQLKPTKQDNNDGRMMTLTFEPYAKSGFLPKHYEGNIPFALPHAIADIEAVALTVANGIEYKVPALDTTAAMEVASTDLPHNEHVVFHGGGGADPATIATGTAGAVTVLLKNGTAWVALAGARIHFQVFLAGATKYLVELSRE